MVKLCFIEHRHASAVQVLAADFAVAEWTRLPHPYPEDGAVNFIEMQILERKLGKAFVFAIEVDEQFVGVCGLHEIRDGVSREFGFWLGKPYWGKGYASIAAKSTLEFGFRDLALKRVEAVALESNHASRRILEKNGFALIELAKHHDPYIHHKDERLAKYALVVTPIS